MSKSLGKRPQPEIERPSKVQRPNQFYQGECSTSREVNLSRSQISQRERRIREKEDRQRSHRSRQPNINRQLAQRARRARMETQQTQMVDTVVEPVQPSTVSPLTIVVCTTPVTMFSEQANNRQIGQRTRSAREQGQQAALEILPESEFFEPTPLQAIVEISHETIREQPNPRQLGQRARRARERAQQAALETVPESEFCEPTPLQAIVEISHETIREQPNPRQLGQRARRARERAQQAFNHSEQPNLFVLPLHNVPENEILDVAPLQSIVETTRDQPNPRQLGQRARRARERAQQTRFRVEQPNLPVQHGDGPNAQNADGRPLPNEPPVEEAEPEEHYEVENEPVHPHPVHEMGRHSLGRMNIECPFCRALHWIDERLKKSPVGAPLFGKCCSSGQNALPNLRTPPLQLQNLFTAQDPRSRHFRNNARAYNLALAFTSLGVRSVPGVIPGFGPRPFTIHGELRHQTGGLLPEGGNVPVYAQLYIYDPQNALEFRVQRNEWLQRDVLQQLQQIILENNAFVPLYRQAHEILARADNVGISVPAVLHFRPKTDERRYNQPTTDEIAVIIPGDGTDISRTRDIVLHLRSNQALQRISECHAAYLPLHYVLFFPFGELGWVDGLTRWDPVAQRPTDDRLTRLEWFRYRLFSRPTEFSSILRGQRLFQEFVVDAWAATEQNNLCWVRFNQSKLRAELYQTLRETAAAGLLGREAGRVILPSSYTGGPRYMYEIYQNSMAITRYNNHPDVFVTMTANPKWPEITAALLPGQTSVDRPDLVCRVFELKKRALIKDIKIGKIFGDTVGDVHTIEFQKRGLPHMHLLIFLSRPYKIRNASDVDRIVCAELPDPCAEPELYRTITTSMIHGPCGARNMNCVCMENNRCSKKYPKAFTETTTMDQDGYPVYRRRDVRRFTNSKGMEISNQDVVPYNPFLCRKYDCHINVEVCAGIRCVKYIHKYIYKGHDRTTIVIGEADEIKSYLDARYVGPSEALWRLLEFRLHQENPTVIVLDLHMPGMHHVVYDEREELDSVLERARTQRSKLIAFFERCADGCTCTYQEMPQYYRWDSGLKIWVVRKQQPAIGRIRLVPPTAGDIFYLRLLLTVVPGPSSYDYLRTFDNVVYSTFKAAASARGLLENDDEWAKCLEEAAVMKTGHQLRRLFAVIIYNCGPSHPEELWNKFNDDLCDDVAHKLRTERRILDPTDAEITDYGLYLLNELLHENGKDLADYPPMPLPVGNWVNANANRLLEEHRQLFREATNINIDEQLELLNSDQRKAFDEIYASVNGGEAKMFFLNGGAGTGKTFVYNTLATRCRLDEKIVITVASSGIAALLLLGGRTSHSVFGIPLDILENSVCSITKQSIHADLLRHADVLIWDEVPMQNRYCLEAVDRLLQDLRDDNRWFGGLTVVMGGDFRQILPVVPKGSRENIVAVTLQRSILWLNIKVLHLHVNMRLRNAADNDCFARFLQQVGTSPEDTIRLPAELHKCQSIDDLINRVYPNLNNAQIADAQYLTRRTLLSARNDDVAEVNSKALELFHGTSQTYLAADTIHNDERQPQISETYGNEYINKLNPSGIPPFELRLKIGCPIIMLRNLAPKDGLCNGTRLMVVNFATRIVEARILTGPKAGNLVFIPRISLYPSARELPITFSRRQFPVKLAFAMTINKSQGQSVEVVGIDLRTEVFTHGQLYVALSRCTNFRSISVLLEDPKKQTTTNIVYPEVLL